MCSTTLYRNMTLNQIAMLANPVDIGGITDSGIVAKSADDLVDDRIMSTFLIGNFEDDTAGVFELWALLINCKLDDDHPEEDLGIDRWNNEGGFIRGSVH